MAATFSYEVHVMRGGRWVTAGTYQAKDDALRDARGSMRRRTVGIRVVEEIFDPERDRYVTRTIYRDQSLSELGAIGGGTGRGAVPAGIAAAVGRNIEIVDEPFKAVAFALIGLSSVALAGIAALFWFELV